MSCGIVSGGGWGVVPGSLRRGGMRGDDSCFMRWNKRALNEVGYYSDSYKLSNLMSSTRARPHGID